MRLLLYALVILIYSCESRHKPASGTPGIPADTLHHTFKWINTLDSPDYYKNQVGPVELKGGYKFLYAADDSMKYIYLAKGDRQYLLNKTPLNEGSFYNLGTVAADEDDYLVVGYDNGNSCPYSYELFSKSTGTNLLGKNILFEDFTTFRDTLFTLYHDVEKGKLVLFNVKTKNEEIFNAPADLPQFLELSIDKLTRNNLAIAYSDFTNPAGKRKRAYSRYKL